MSTGPKERDVFPGTAGVLRIGPKARPSTGTQNWEREQETLYVLQSRSLMEQIERSLKTHREGTGYRPSPEELDPLDRL